MKLRRVRVENVRSFLDSAELSLDGDISIMIGPNGGGKTNLLDTISTTLRRHLLKSWICDKSSTPEIPKRRNFRLNNALSGNNLDKHSKGIDRDQVVEVDLEVTAVDISNMRTIYESAIDIADKIEHLYTGVPWRTAQYWNLELLTIGQSLRYKILNNTLQNPADPATRIYQEYLALYEIDNRLRSDLGLSHLAMPMISMPVNRSSGNFQTAISLANYNDNDIKQGVDASTSRSAGSAFSLAIGRIASKFRLLLEADAGNAHQKLRDDPQIALLTTQLGSLGYQWQLECTDALTNEYDIRLEKQGSSFLVHAASSGEKELLTYLFAIYGLNVRDALIVIDEPELHLHPRWQSTLLKLFERLTNDTGNQFLLATHSPVFVSPASIQYISRVYSKEQSSNIVRLKNDALPQEKHLLSMVNSQNNERMFFADTVILVEGISDRIFFDAVFRKLGVFDESTLTWEIVEVGGKGFFGHYETLLIAAQVPYTVIADLDYLNDIGTPSLKSLFAVNNRNIMRDVINNPTSRDGNSLVTSLDEAIKSGNTEGLKVLWEYIKARQLKLSEGLSREDKKRIGEFIEQQRTLGIFVLSMGALESYLPLGHSSKDLDKLLRLISGDFWPNLSPEARDELTLIAKQIKSRAVGNSDSIDEQTLISADIAAETEQIRPIHAVV